MYIKTCIHVQVHVQYMNIIQHVHVHVHVQCSVHICIWCKTQHNSKISRNYYQMYMYSVYPVSELTWLQGY